MTIMIGAYFLVLQCVCISLHAQVISESEPAIVSKENREGLAGGLSDADVNGEDIKNATAFAVVEVDKRSNSAYKQVLVRIISAKTQVVAGTLYHLELEIGDSSCNKASNVAISECTLKEESNNQICDVKVWDRPWLSKREVTEVSCGPKSQRNKRAVEQERGVPGGLSNTDVNDPNIKNIAAFALTEIDQTINSAYKQTLVQILSAETQVVAGTLYHLQLVVGDSNCSKNDSDMNSACALKEDSIKQYCNVKVLEQLWMNVRKVTEVKCRS